MAIGRSVGRKSVQQILIELKLISAENLIKAEKEAARLSCPLQQVVIDMGFVGKVSVLQALSREWHTKAVDLVDMDIDVDVVKLLPEVIARRIHVLPFAKEGQTLLVAMADPGDFSISEDIYIRTGCEVQGYLAMPEDILKGLEKVYGLVGSNHAAEILKSIANKRQSRAGAVGPGEGLSFGAMEEKTDVTEMDPFAPEVERIVNALIVGALQIQASDIHLEPFEDALGKNSRLVVRYRVDGFMRESDFEVPWSYRNAIIAKIKIMTSTMNITERRIPQSGRVQVVAKGNPIEFRVEIVPTVYGESCTMRILDRKAVQVNIEKLGFSPETLNRLMILLSGVGGKKNFGLVLVCGPTGSGKTTTLYACLNHINRPDIKILTAENPVEYNLDGVLQIQVNPDLKLGEDKCFDFPLALRSFLRLDPDVIMVGEIRDRETAHIAMEAAMTGHLVFSTIHTNDAPSSVARLTEMGIPPFMVASTLKCVLAQRLCRRLCLACRVPRAPTVEEVEIYKSHHFPLPVDAKLYTSKGCDSCGGSGFKGRMGIHELLLIDDPVRLSILKDVTADGIRHAALKESPQKLRTLVVDGLAKVLTGETTVREVIGGVSEDTKKKE
jgi:type IV pilus assembly protein PilB